MFAWRYIGIAFMVAAISVLSIGGVQADTQKESTIEEIIQRGTLRVGMSTFKPWAMRDKQGELIGFEIDVAKKLAADLGVQVEFVPTQWSGIIPALLTGKFDVIIGGMSKTTERNLKINFTNAYDYSGQAMVASKRLAEGMDSLVDYNKPDVTIIARTGTTAAMYIKEAFPNATHRFFETEGQCEQELLLGRGHAFVSSAPSPAMLALRQPGKLFLPFDDTLTKEPIGFAVRKGDVDTLNVFNNWIAKQWLNGFLEARHTYWFESLDWESQVQ